MEFQLEVKTSNYEYEVRPYGEAFLMVQGSSPTAIERVASIAHEATGRWAKVGYVDIAESAKSVDQIWSLGAITIFVPDISMLKPTDRENIIDYLKEYRRIGFSSRVEGPLFILGSHQQLSYYADSGVMNQDELEVLKNSFFRAEQLPTDFARLKQTMEILFEPAPGV